MLSATWVREQRLESCEATVAGRNPPRFRPGSKSAGLRMGKIAPDGQELREVRTPSRQSTRAVSGLQLWRTVQARRSRKSLRRRMIESCKPLSETVSQKSFGLRIGGGTFATLCRKTARLEASLRKQLPSPLGLLELLPPPLSPALIEPGSSLTSGLARRGPLRPSGPGEELLEAPAGPYRLSSLFSVDDPRCDRSHLPQPQNSLACLH